MRGEQFELSLRGFSGPMERPGRARVRACSQVVECADAEASEALLLWIDGCPGI